MKLVLMMLVHNDAAILEQSLTYHLRRGVDHVVAIDDHSTDGAAEVLKTFERDGGLTLVPRPAGVWNQDSSRWRTALARQIAAEHRPDWILASDPDELWWPLEGDLRDAFATVPAERDLVFAPRHDFVYPPDATGEKLAHEVEVRELWSNLGPKVAFRPYPDVVVGGSHRVARDPSSDELTVWDSGRILSVSSVVPVRIFHYGVRHGSRFQAAVRSAGSDARKARKLQGRDVLFRLAFDDRTASARWETGAEWRRQALERGLETGTLIRDRRVADYLQGREGTPSPEAGEAMELQRFVMEELMRRDTRLRKRTRLLRDRLAGERSLPARRAGLHLQRLSGRLRGRRA